MIRRWKALALAAALLAAPAAFGQETEKTLEQVLEGYYEALGGLDTLKALDTVRLRGTMSMQGGQMQAPFTITFQRPDKARLEFTFQGMTGIQSYDGGTAWFVMPFMGKTEPEKMTADQAKMMREQADFDGPLVGIGEKDSKVELLGRESLEGTDAYNIRVETPEGDVRHYFLDAEYYLPIKVAATTTVQGQKVESETTLGDYKKVGGVMLAHSISTQPKGAPAGAGQSITVESAEVGVDLEDGYFSMPAPAPKAATGG